MVRSLRKRHLVAWVVIGVVVPVVMFLAWTQRHKWPESMPLKKYISMLHKINLPL